MLTVIKDQAERACWRVEVLDERRKAVESWGADGRSVDVARLDELLKREVKSPFEEEEWMLDVMEWTIVNYRYDPDIMARRMATLLLRDLSEEGERFVANSRVNPMAWRICQALVGMLRESERLEDLNESPLHDWILDAAQGIRSEPTKRGRDPHENIVRNCAITFCVFQIREVGLRPATSSNLDGSACHLVANRLKCSYETVRGIWRRFNR